METFRKVRDDFVKEITDTNDGDKVLKAHAKLKGLEAVLKKLHHYLEDGHLAKQEVEWVEKTRKNR